MEGETRFQGTVYVIAGFAGGAVVLGLEVLAARTLAPHLGTGSAVWSALSAVALGSLAAGNLIGGWACERLRLERFVMGLLLGGLSPILIRAGGGSGRWTGIVLAAGSRGGIAGALMTGLWLLPAIGLAKTYFGLASLLIVGAVLCARSIWRGWG